MSLRLRVGCCCSLGDLRKWWVCLCIEWLGGRKQDSISGERIFLAGELNVLLPACPGRGFYIGDVFVQTAENEINHSF